MRDAVSKIDSKSIFLYFVTHRRLNGFPTIDKFQEGNFAFIVPLHMLSSNCELSYIFPLLDIPPNSTSHDNIP